MSPEWVLGGAGGFGLRRRDAVSTIGEVHPIEHLRYLAGAPRVDDVTLAREAAYALSAMPDDPAMMVIVCRRLLERHQRSAPLWWLCSSVLVSSEPGRTAWELLQRLEGDHTLDALAAAIPAEMTVAVRRWTDSASAISAARTDVNLVDADDGPTRGTVPAAVIEAVAASPERVLIDRSDEPLMNFESRFVVCRLGTRLPEPIVAEMLDRCEPQLSSVALSEFSTVVSDDGARSAAEAGAVRPDGPFAPELLRRSVGP